MPDHNQSSDNSRLSGLRRRMPVRTALLGAVAVAAVGGGLAQSTLFGNDQAYAQQIKPQATPDQIAPGSFADVVDRVSPAVVSVKVKITEDASDDDNSQPAMPNIPKGDPLERFFRQFGQGNMPHAKPRTGQAQGSGFFISADGYIVTNNHVVEHATDVNVTMQDGQTLPATVIGTDKKTDLALLKVKSTDNKTFAYVPWTDHTPRVGDWVIAVGNPFGLGGTVTAGIVSARGRDIGAGPYDDFLQIDAPVNRGNSGGPTFNTAGQVVGVNTAIFSPSGGSVGIGFAIPAEVAKDVVASLKEHGSVARGWIGVQIQPVTSDIADSLGLKGTKGALVAEPQKGSPAADAGVKSGDVITSVNGDTIDGPRELARKIASMGPDKKVDLTIWRDGGEKTLSMTLGTLPTDKEAKAETTSPSDSDRSQLTSFGMTLAPASSIAGAGKQGVVISDIDPDGTAAQKGLSTGDVILDVGGKSVTRPSEVKQALEDAKKDGHRAVLLRVKTGDNTRFVALAVSSAG
ncbi:Do family serine endopeptidase [Lichenifustis flavocetrariae]|uniref:Probable periplasmic serine endoprotease DegP-like n=1 Tax=Lichenifustis flavocetrariae TaxID=2949735 RepID=A0AA42CKQ3_9HYPH|nr:Do family serine endopeptidase [Lichenifustis flavocetrariae]MCW6506530.1 Do family serine endopeptidase [Lichenifustis flavocetrariae]